MANELPDPTDDTLSFDILTGMRDWREQHPNATLREIEEALDERWYRVRAYARRSRAPKQRRQLE